MNVPEDLYNHGMDGLRYAITDLYPLEDEKKPNDPYKDKLPGTFFKPHDYNKDEGGVYEGADDWQDEI